MILFASDYDGTLYFHNENGGFFKDRDLLKIHEFREKGHLFSLCTGRIIDTIRKVLVDNVEFDYVIASTGGVIFNQQLKDFYHTRCDFLSLKDIYLKYSDTYDFYYHVDGYPYVVGKGYSQYDYRIEIASIDDIKDKEIVGVSVYTPNEDSARNLCLTLNDNYPLLAIFQNRNWLDIVDKSVSKGISALKLKNLTNADLLVGIGDSYNDIELLKAADISFTFHDSPEEVKQYATYLVDSISEAIDIVLSLK